MKAKENYIILLLIILFAIMVLLALSFVYGLTKTIMLGFAVVGFVLFLSNLIHP